MKVGILTQHRVPNYGSLLQAYALQQVLFNNGIDNEIIDYIYPNIAHRKNISCIRRLKITVLPLLYRLKIKHRPIETLPPISNYWKEYLITTKCCFKNPTQLRHRCPKYDVYITGSDQVWNTDYLNGDTSFFFPWIKKNNRKISYAASFGKFSFQGQKAIKWLKNIESYSAISVREKGAVEIIKKYVNQNVIEVLDPTLLLARDQWMSFGGIANFARKDYILVYLLKYVWDPMPAAIKLIDLLKYSEKKVVVIDPEQTVPRNLGWEIVENATPKEFVRLIAEAEMVVTNSFHGTAFAINLNTPFYALVKENRVNDDRITSLLNKVELSDRKVSDAGTFVDTDNLNFVRCNELLQGLREKSMNYLLNNIK